MHEEKNEIRYLLAMIGLMIVANVLLNITPSEQLKELVPYVTPTTILFFLIHFFVRRKMLRQKFRKYLEHTPIKSPNYKLKYITKAVHAGVFFATELFSMSILSLYVFALAYGTGGDDFVYIQVWELVASFAVFPFLGQLMPLLLKWDEKHHKASQEKAGLRYHSYY